MGKMILLLCISFLWNTLLDGGHMTCVRPPRHLASIKGKEGELVTKLHLKQPGFWSTAASVKGTGEDVSQFFTTVLTDGRDLTQWQVRVAKPLNTELRGVTVIKLTLHCTVEGRTTPFFSEFVLRPPQKRKAERIRPVLEVNVNKDTKVGAVFHALSEDFPDSGRDIFEMVKAGDTNYKQELVIGDVNEHPPEFDLSRSYNISISESTSVGSNVFSLRHVARDPDVTGRIILYSLSPYDDPEADGRQCFRISDDGSHLVLLQPIDFDQMIIQGRTYFKLNLTATDTGKPGPLSSSIIMTVHVTDTDDQGPAFVYPNCLMIDNYCSLPYYQAVIKCDFKGLLRVYPGPVLAIDKDTQDHFISYSLTRVEPEKFFDKFDIEKDTGKIHVVKPSCAPNVDEFLITVTATENSPAEHSISTTLQIEVLDALVVPNMA